MSDKRFYWIKLKRDFFKRHDTTYMRSLPDGDKIVLFYLMLMAESTDHSGALRFSEDIPYSPDILASITNTPKKVVIKALETLKALKLIEISEDGTFYMSKFDDMTSCETHWAKKKREYRERQGQTEDTERTERGQTEDNVPSMSDKSIEIRDKRLEIRDKSIDISFSGEKNKKFVPPTVEEVYEYCESRHNGIDAQLFVDYNTARGWRGIKDWKALIRVWENNPNTYRKDTES